MNAQIQEVLQRMRLVYLAKLPQRLDAMETLVCKLRQDDVRADSFENLHRAVHTLKGTAGTYGLPIITAICKPFENCLTAAHESGMSGSDQLTNCCMHYIGLLREAINQLEAGEESCMEVDAYLNDIPWPATCSPSAFRRSS
jgi:chemotaxis protein histidine kinase CheA